MTSNLCKSGHYSLAVETLWLKYIVSWSTSESPRFCYYIVASIRWCDQSDFKRLYVQCGVCEVNHLASQPSKKAVGDIIWSPRTPPPKAPPWLVIPRAPFMVIGGLPKVHRILGTLVRGPITDRSSCSWGRFFLSPLLFSRSTRGGWAFWFPSGTLWLADPFYL